jgi:hypothetical protein
MEQSSEIKKLRAQLAKAERQSKSDRAFINTVIAQKKEMGIKLSHLFAELSKYEGVRGLRLQLKQITKMLKILNKVN